MAVSHMRPQTALGARRLGWSWPAIFVLLVLMIGFRHEVGADWGGYLVHLDEMQDVPFLAILTTKDLAYGLLNWFGANVVGDIYLVNLGCACLFCWGLAAFCRQLPRPWLALFIAIPYLVVVVAMGYSRQGVAIGLAMLAISRLTSGSFSLFLFWITLAALFHKTVVILLPFAVFSASRHRGFAIFGAVFSAALLFVVLLQDQLEYLAQNYVEVQLESTGAGIRIVMNAVPAALLLIFRRRFSLEPRILNFWIWIAWSALLFIPLLMISPSSTAIDRVALYWIPLQLLIYSRLPDAIGRPRRRNSFWVFLIAAYTSILMLGWLFFSSKFASYWVPYRFYPWVALWS
jgi:hypothetical protein